MESLQNILELIKPMVYMASIDLRDVGGEAREFLWGLSNMLHILMGHEIFFKIFDESQNIFLCSILVILFSKLRGLEHKISKLAIKEI